MKRLVRWLAVVAVVLVVVGTVLAFTIDSIVGAAVSRGGEYALGVPTRASGVSLRPFAGQVGLSGLEIENPEGFRSPFFLRLERASLGAAPASLLSDVVEVSSLELEGLELYLERGKSGTNYGKILKSLERFESKSKEPAPDESGGGKKFIAHEIVLRDLRVHTDLAPELGGAAKTALTIPELRLREVGTTEGGASIAEICSQVVKAVLAAVVAAGGDVLPADLLDDLQGSLGKLGAEDLRELRDQIGDSLDKLGKGLKGGAGRALEDLGKGLDKLFK